MAVEHGAFRQAVRANKQVLRGLAGLLTSEIRKRGASQKPDYLDFRFLLPLSQWLLEQGGYTLKPQGNNPGNVMAEGDMGTFQRSFNTEFVDGKRVPAPDAKFAAYSNMTIGTAATFDQLKINWPAAYAAILQGGAPAMYVTGLFPGPHKNYATASQSSYLSAVHYRLKNAIIDCKTVAEDDIKEADARIPQLQSQLAKPNVDAVLAPEIQSRVAGNQSLKDKLNDQIKELGEIDKRFQAGQALQPQ